MSYILPQGWTEHRLRKATRNEVLQLSLEDCMYLNIKLIENPDARKAAAERHLQAAFAMINVARPSKPTSLLNPPAYNQQNSKDLLVEVVERLDLDGFGFLLFRLDYSDHAKWFAWEKKCEEMVKASLEKVAGIGLLRKRTINNWTINDPVLSGQTVQDVPRLYSHCKTVGMVAEGPDLNICVAVDKEARDSLLEPSIGIEPWVWIVDTSLSSFREVVTEEIYPGYFKAALSTLFPELYPTLAGQSVSFEELWFMANPVFVRMP